MHVEYEETKHFMSFYSHMFFKLTLVSSLVPALNFL